MALAVHWVAEVEGLARHLVLVVAWQAAVGATPVVSLVVGVVAGAAVAAARVVPVVAAGLVGKTGRVVARSEQPKGP